MDPRAGYYGGAPPQPTGGGVSPSPSLDSVEMTPPASPAQHHAYGAYGGGGGTSTTGMRRRHAGQTHANGRYDGNGFDDKYAKASRRRARVRRLDMFPKVQEDYQVRTDRGGLVTLVGYGVALVLVLAEWASWKAERGRVVEHTFVDTR